MPKTYKALSLLCKNYFDVLCEHNNYSREEYDIEEVVDDKGYSTFTIHIWSDRCDKMIQKVFTDANS